MSFAGLIELAAARAWVRGAIDHPNPEQLLAAVRGVRIAGAGSIVRAVLTRPAIERPTWTVRRDQASVEHHYDVSNRFYELVLGSSMVYTCALWRGEGDTLGVAQHRKIDHILDKLDVQREQSLVDLGCGWGTLVDAATSDGIHAIGVTPSKAQIAWAREHRRGIFTQAFSFEHRGGPYDYATSVGVIEHAGLGMYDDVARLLRPGGRALVHGITKARPGRTSKFIRRYVFPDGQLYPFAAHARAAVAAGLKIEHVEAIGSNYPRTLRAWLENLQRNRVECVRLVGEQRYRVWLLYMTASADAFERGDLNVHQLLLRRADA